MSILNIKEKFSKRILEAENDNKEESIKNTNGVEIVHNPCTRVSLQEVDVGISEYVSDLPGFDGVIKQRFSDFNVHEIDMEGKVAVLDSYEVPNEAIEIDTDEFSLIEPNLIEDLDKLVAENEEVHNVMLDVSNNSKEERKSIHQFLKSKYGSSIVSNTTDEGDKKIISVKRAADCKGENRRVGHLPKFVHFILSKSNMDTTEALSVLGTKLKLKVSNFSTAGTKDKRANTSQWVCIKNIYASKLERLNNALRKMRVGNFIYKNHGLALGSLKGNKFNIALRNITASDYDISFAMEKLKTHGFINYFGLQRFGNSVECPTHEVGRQLVKESYARAVDLILKPRQSQEQPDMRQAREIWARTKDPSQALPVLRRRDRTIEGQVLAALKRHGPTAYVNALDSIPRNVCLLYLHAYQSFLWNKVVSKRIAKYGLKVLVGDLILADVEPVVQPSEDEVSEDLIEKPCPVKYVTEEALSSYTIYDVLMPIPGYATIFPKNEAADWFNELLAEDGLTTESFNSRIRKYSLPGSYRKMLGLPGNVDWRLVNYSSPEDDLILSDIDIMDGKTLPDRPEGSYRALILSFDLDRSTYATMALREILRVDTSASNQAELNNAIKNNDEGVPAKRTRTEDPNEENSVTVNH